MDKLKSIITNIVVIILILLMGAILIGIALFIAGLVWNGALMIWGMIL